MSNCCLCGKEDGNTTKKINGKIYNFCSECNFNINNLTKESARKYVMNSEYIMNSIALGQYNDLTNFINTEISKGLLESSDTKTTEEDLSEEILRRLGKDKVQFYNNDNIFWTKILRVISIINLICGIIIGLFLWWYIADNMYRGGGIIGFGACLGFILGTFIVTSGIMVFVEMSENMAKNKENTDKILELLKKK